VRRNKKERERARRPENTQTYTTRAHPFNKIEVTLEKKKKQQQVCFAYINNER
jgi:hypothetical protein